MKYFLAPLIMPTFCIHILRTKIPLGLSYKNGNPVKWYFFTKKSKQKTEAPCKRCLFCGALKFIHDSGCVKKLQYFLYRHSSTPVCDGMRKDYRDRILYELGSQNIWRRIVQNWEIKSAKLNLLHILHSEGTKILCLTLFTWGYF